MAFHERPVLGSFLLLIQLDFWRLTLVSFIVLTNIYLDSYIGVTGDLQRLEVMDERVVDDVGRREAVLTTRLRSGQYIKLDMGPRKAASNR
jgi:hypothetical protein